MMDEKRDAHPEEALSAYLDGELEPVERAAIDEHLRACPACADLLEDLRCLDAAAAADLAPPVPADLAGRISGRLSSPRVVEMPRRRRTLKSWLGPIPLAAAATLAAVAVLATVQVIGPGEVRRQAPPTTPEEDTQGPVATGRAVREETLRPVSDKRDTLKGSRAVDETEHGAGGSERDEETEERLAELRSLGYVADGTQRLAPPEEGKAAGVMEAAAPPAGKKGPAAALSEGSSARPVAADADRAREPAEKLRAMAPEPPRPSAVAEMEVPEKGRALWTGSVTRRRIVLDAPGYRIGITEDGDLTLRSAEYLCAVTREDPSDSKVRGTPAGVVAARPVAEKAKDLRAEIEDLFRIAALLREATEGEGPRDDPAAAGDAPGESWVVSIADPGEPLLRFDAPAGGGIVGGTLGGGEAWEPGSPTAMQGTALQDESTRRYLAARIAQRIRTLARRDYAALLESRCGPLPESLGAPE